MRQPGLLLRGPCYYCCAKVPALLGCYAKEPAYCCYTWHCVLWLQCAEYVCCAFCDIIQNESARAGMAMTSAVEEKQMLELEDPFANMAYTVYYTTL